jgi:2-polyprenyl-3-methyl-5-hydroxy-6-metoxy-1,4-benzoquinol methylase
MASQQSARTLLPGIIPPRATMPDPELYEQEFDYWPWGNLLQQITEWTVANAPTATSILDYMCGTGYLLNSISALRKDLSVTGCDIAQLT